jgi:hypothetical protein
MASRCQIRAHGAKDLHVLSKEKVQQALFRAERCIDFHRHVFWSVQLKLSYSSHMEESTRRSNKVRLIHLHLFKKELRLRDRLCNILFFQQTRKHRQRRRKPVCSHNRQSLLSWKYMRKQAHHQDALLLKRCAWHYA